MNKEILRLAIPNIISNISIPLIATVDTALMGRFSALHIGAVGVGAMIFNFIYWNFGFLRMGTTGMTAQAFGQKDKTRITQLLGQALVVAGILAFIVLILQKPLGDASFYLMNIEGEQLTLVAKYFNIRIWAAPATLALYALMGWFFGLQNAIIPLILTVTINLVNILANFFFIYYLEMDVEGVAWGTVIAQYTGLLLGLFFLFRRYSSYLKLLSNTTILQIHALKQFLSINRDIFIRTLCLTFAFGFFYSQSATQGAMILAVNVILLQYLNWMSYAVDGFAYATESLVGKYKGANDEIKLNKTIRLNFIWGMGLAILFSLVYALFGEQFLYIFTDKSEVIAASIPYLFWMILLPILATPCYIWDGVYIGLTASKAMRNSMLLALGLYLMVHYSIISLWGNHSLWGALLFFLFLRGLIQWLLYLKYDNALA